MTALLHRPVPRVQGEIKGPWNYWSPFCIYLALTWTLTCQLMTSLTFIESTSKTGNNQLQLLWNSSPRWLATEFSSLGSSYVQSAPAIRDHPIYINDNLTKRNAHVFALARRLVKDKVIHSAWTPNGYTLRVMMKADLVKSFYRLSFGRPYGLLRLKM